MKRVPGTTRLIALTGGLVFVLFLQVAHPQTSEKKTGVQQELVQTEMGFFEAWKAKDAAYFHSHIPENGIFWGQSGTLSREELLEEMQTAAKACIIEGYGLSVSEWLPIEIPASESTRRYLKTKKDKLGHLL